MGRAAHGHGSHIDDVRCVSYHAHMTTTANPPRDARSASTAACCGSDAAVPPLGEEAAIRASRRFRALADPTRLRLLSLLAKHGGHVCVCDVVDAFTLEQPTISYHLRVLREAGLVSVERRGQWAYYRAEPAALAVVRDLFSAVE